MNSLLIILCIYGLVIYLILGVVETIEFIDSDMGESILMIERPAFFAFLLLHIVFFFIFFGGSIYIGKQIYKLLKRIGD